MLAKWQGPYHVSRKLGSTTYNLEMPDKRKQWQAFHVNLQKEWHEREMDFSHLTLQQQLELWAIVPDGLFSEQPGNTSLVDIPSA